MVIKIGFVEGGPSLLVRYGANVIRHILKSDGYLVLQHWIRLFNQFISVDLIQTRLLASLLDGATHFVATSGAVTK